MEEMDGNGWKIRKDKSAERVNPLASKPRGRTSNNYEQLGIKDQNKS